MSPGKVERRGYPILYHILRDRSVVIGQGGSIGRTIEEILIEQRMRPMVAGESFSSIKTFIREADSFVIHIPRVNSLEASREISESMEEIWSVNRRIVLLGDYFNEYTAPMYQDFLGRECPFVNRMQDFLEDSVPPALARLFQRYPYTDTSS